MTHTTTKEIMQKTLTIGTNQSKLIHLCNAKLELSFNH